MNPDRCENFPRALPLLLVATGNRHKTSEFRGLLAAHARVKDLSDFPSVQPAEETGATFEENAALKAVSAARETGHLALADDSGLEVDLLDGAPGVYSARYAGVGASDAENRKKLLQEILRADPAHVQPRTARFRCVLALAGPEGSLVGTWSGTVEGRILAGERGQGGFGYDSVFQPLGYELSFAEMPASAKNHISHRARAAAGFLRYLQANPLT